jgi:hypothetical protein
MKTEAGNHSLILFWCVHNDEIFQVPVPKPHGYIWAGPLYLQFSKVLYSGNWSKLLYYFSGHAFSAPRVLCMAQQALRQKVVLHFNYFSAWQGQVCFANFLNKTSRPVMRDRTNLGRPYLEQRIYTLLNYGRTERCVLNILPIIVRKLSDVLLFR